MGATTNQGISNVKKIAITHVSRSVGVQAVADNTATAISFDTVTRDDVGAYSAGAPTRVTPPAWATHCRIYAHMEWEINATGYRSMRVNFGGIAAALPQYSPTVVQAATGVISDHNCGMTNWMPITPALYLELMVRQNSTVSLNALTSNTQLIVEWGIL